MQSREVMVLTQRQRVLAEAGSFLLAFLGVVGILVVQYLGRDARQGGREDIRDTTIIIQGSPQNTENSANATDSTGGPGPVSTTTVTNAEVRRTETAAPTTAPPANALAPTTAAPPATSAPFVPGTSANVAVAPAVTVPSRPTVPTTTTQMEPDAAEPVPYDAAVDALPLAPQPADTMGAGRFSTDSPPDRGSSWVSNPEAGAGPF